MASRGAAAVARLALLRPAAAGAPGRTRACAECVVGATAGGGRGAAAARSVATTAAAAAPPPPSAGPFRPTDAVAAAAASTTAAAAATGARGGAPRSVSTSATSKAAAGGVAAKRNATPFLAGTRLDPSESFLTGANATVLEDMYERYLVDPSKVQPSWVAFFRNLEADVPPGEAIAVRRANRNTFSNIPSTMTEGKDLFQVSEDTIKLMSMIRAFRHRGHLVADLDPLRIDEDSVANVLVPYKTRQELEPSYYGFTEADMDREFVVSGELPGPPVRKLREVVDMLRKVYLGKVGYEYRHMLSKEEKVWLASHVEAARQPVLAPDEKKTVLRDLADSELFEAFLAVKHATAKRFGMEGAEAVLPGLQAMVEHGSDLGIENVVVGMPHRGRLNVLANLVHKPLDQIFHEFTPHEDPDNETYLGSGDVKYHLGTSQTRSMRNGRSVHFSLMANPSHLEAVDPVVVGKTRAKQFFLGDTERKRTMGLLLHGDASFAGQGVVAETLELSDLRDYTTGGTIHVIVNNQIGFTTDPRYARSSPYPTDVGKLVGVPIFHVNGDDVESVVRVCKLAMEYRQRFNKDVIVDVFCYRRHGHNELDQPMFTQPLMYQKIKSHPTPLKVYSDQLLAEGVISEEELKELKDEVMGNFAEKFANAKDWKARDKDWLASHWEGFKSPQDLSSVQMTGVSEEKLQELGSALTRVPEGFKMHPQLKKIMTDRRKHIELGEGIDWATAESLAFASLLDEGTSVRLSGQDSERGTFSQRHSVWHDQSMEKVYVPLNNLGPNQAAMQVCNSNLSEMAVLGFEVGFSLESPKALVMWEAQFGDFVNGAQVIIDTFISAGERKWRRQSGITLLLPHGYEGQGPEHSSSRMERFLQSCDDDEDVVPPMDPEVRQQIQNINWQVVNASTPANYFHVLRRQVHRDFRKPLVIITPKSLLRHPGCKSDMSDFVAGKFRRVIPEESPAVTDAPEQVRKVVFCSGKVYYNLMQERLKRKQTDVAIARVEQIAPFPFDLVAEEVRKYPGAQLIWTQEESKNMGAWSYVKPRFQTAIRHFSDGADNRLVSYVGREPSAAPATGNPMVHKEEQDALVNESLA